MSARLGSFLLLLAALLSVTVCLAAPLDPAPVNAKSDCRKGPVNVNQLFDYILPVLRKFVIKHGMDPMPSKDIWLHLPGLIIRDRYFNLTNGWLQGLTGLTRAKDILLSYEDRVLTLDATLGFDVLDVNYEYIFKDSLVSRSGDVYGRVQNMVLRVVLSLDMKHYRVVLSTLKVKSIRKVDLKLMGHVIDPILNAAIKGVTTVFRRTVTNLVEDTCWLVIERLVKELNENIPPPDAGRGKDAFEFVPLFLASRAT